MNTKFVLIATAFFLTVCPYAEASESAVEEPCPVRFKELPAQVTQRAEIERVEFNSSKGAIDLLGSDRLMLVRATESDEKSFYGSYRFEVATGGKNYALRNRLGGLHWGAAGHEIKETVLRLAKGNYRVFLRYLQPAASPNVKSRWAALLSHKLS